MRAGGFSWLGAALVACGAAAGGLELHAQAAEAPKARAIPAEHRLIAQPVAAGNEPAPEVSALTSVVPASVQAKSARLAADTRMADTRMSEEEAALHLARAFRSVVDSPPSASALSLLWAHWAHETGRGRRMYGFNFGGLKGRGPGGASLFTWTREAVGEDRGLVQRTFRVYPSAEAGAKDYLELLAQRFPSALRAARRGNVRLFVDALSTRGYFTDDPKSYERALGSLNSECRRRGLAESALRRLYPEESFK